MHFIFTFLHVHLYSPENCPVILANLINQCTKIPYEERPTFTKILEFCKQDPTHN